MSTYYYYNEEKCEFIPVHSSSLKQRGVSGFMWLLVGILLSGAFIAGFSFFIGTPSELALRAEKEALARQLKSTKKTIKEMDQQIDRLAHRDNEMYRSVLGMDPISYEEREAGSGGADIYKKFDVYSQETADILKWTAQNLESLEQSIKIQKNSFEEIKRAYNRNQEKLKHLPAIKPAEGIVLSGFGMRYHPVLRYRRSHDGLDFRASVGDPVYATGDGVVKHAALKSTFGRLLIIDHGYGYETYYAHLSSFSKGIKPGAKVKRGDRVGFAGRSGMVEGPHLHYEVHKDSSPVDPLNYLFADTTPEEYMMYKEIVDNNERSMD